MKRLFVRILLGVGGVLLVAVAGLAAYAQLRWDRTFELPAPQLHASADPAVIARGRYLANGPAQCAYCHTPLEEWPKVDAGEEVPFVGGFSFVLPIGTFRSPNITPDAETGIGRYSDAQLARMLRHNVRPNGRAALPVMEFQNLSDEDVVAVISYLRAQRPVHNPVPDHDLNLMGRAVMALLIKPAAPEGPPLATSPADGATIERGAYLANNVAGCVGCHSPRSPMDGSYTGPRFSGGGEMPLDDDPATVLVPPNLTPHPGTGRIVNWTEEQFLARFRAGKIYPGTHMAWPLFGRMSDADLRAIYRYLMSLERVENETGPLMRRAGEPPQQVAKGR